MAEPPDAMPFNALKPLEHGLDNGHAPTQGVHVELPLHGPLDRVRVDSQRRALTTRQGVTVSDNQHALKAGLRGPTLPEDFILRDKLTHFDHERIPERVVHARGAGAHGHFEACESLADLTMADPFAQAGQRTPVFVRSSTVAGERGSADTVRDTRGFAVKFYTRAGTHSLVWDEAVRIAGTEADFHRRDLWEAIEAGHAPAYELALQVATDPQAAAFGFDVLDPTQLVPEELVPLRAVGRRAQPPARRPAPPGAAPRPRRLRAQLAGRRRPVPGRRRGFPQRAGGRAACR